MKCFISHSPRSDLNAIDFLKWKETLHYVPIVSLDILFKNLVQNKTHISKSLLQLWLLGKVENVGESTLYF